MEFNRFDATPAIPNGALQAGQLLGSTMVIAPAAEKPQRVASQGVDQRLIYPDVLAGDPQYTETHLR